MICLQNKTSMVVIFTLFLLIGLIFAFTMVAPVAKAENDNVVNIPDENLEAAIRDAIDKPEEDILPEDMESLFVLYIPGEGVENLTGLEYAVNLEELILRDNQVSDLSPLEGLTNLRWLSLSNNQISDISLLGGLTNVELLWLTGNDVGDISALANMTDMERIWLSRNQVSDISPLEDLTGLVELFLADNQVSDVSALSEMTNLRWLTLQYNYLDISEDSEAMAIINDLIDGGTDVDYEPQKDTEDDPNDDPDSNGDPAPNPEGTIESVVVDVDGDMVEVSIGEFAIAYDQGEDSEYFIYLSGDSDFMPVHAIRSGDKYIGIAEYAKQYERYGDVGDALENAEPLPESEVNEILQLVGFEDDGTPILENG